MVGLMTTLRECAKTAAAALAEKLRASKGNIDAKAIADSSRRYSMRQPANARRARGGVSTQGPQFSSTKSKALQQRTDDHELLAQAWRAANAKATTTPAKGHDARTRSVFAPRPSLLYFDFASHCSEARKKEAPKDRYAIRGRVQGGSGRSGQNGMMPPRACPLLWRRCH